MLIVDVRHNNGGNNALVRPLVRTMVQFDMGGDDRRIVVLTGRNTFTAAQNFINRVEQDYFAGRDPVMEAVLETFE